MPSAGIGTFRACRPDAPAEVVRDAGHVPMIERYGLRCICVNRPGLLSARSWGFSLADVRAEVHAFHGVKDAPVPVDHALALAAGLPRRQARMDPEEGHFLFRRRISDVLEALIGRRSYVR